MRNRPKPERQSDPSVPSRRRQLALLRWGGEGGSGACWPQESATRDKKQSRKLQLTNNELAQIRIRMIALENLVIALLAEAPDRQLDLVREMAAYISPRPGFTHHPLTIHASSHMTDLVERANQFRIRTPM